MSEAIGVNSKIMIGTNQLTQSLLPPLNGNHCSYPVTNTLYFGQPFFEGAFLRSVEIMSSNVFWLDFLSAIIQASAKKNRTKVT